MMGMQAAPERLFYDFCLDNKTPADHLLQRIDRYLDLWAYANDVTLNFSRPGKPTDNGFIEAFNIELRAECLNAHWFMSLADGSGAAGLREPLSAVR